MHNFITYVIIAFAVFCSLLYVILKIDSKRKKKNKKSSKSAIVKKEEQTEDVKKDESVDQAEISDSAETNKSADELASEVKKKKVVKKTKKKPEISRVYERTEKKVEEHHEEDFIPSITEDELLSKMQFVKSSGNVSKLTKFSTLEPETQEALLSEEILVPVKEEPVSQKPEIKHFDKSRRLSKCVECNSFDDMFCSHIGEHYLNINTDRHLKLDEKFHKNLYDRAASTLANSSAKVDADVPRGSASAEGLTRKESMKSWLENKKREELAKFAIAHESAAPVIVDCEHEDINLSARNLLVVDSIIHRKKMVKRK